MKTAIFNIWPNIYLDLVLNKIKLYGLQILIFLLIFILILILFKILGTISQINKQKKEYNDLINKLKQQYKNQFIHMNGKQFIKGFINYLETILVESKYKDLDEILSKIGLKDKDIEIIKTIIYKNEDLEVEKTIKNIKNIIK